MNALNREVFDKQTASSLVCPQVDLSLDVTYQGVDDFGDAVPLLWWTIPQMRWRWRLKLKNLPTPPTDSFRWGFILGLLSLDFVHPLVPDMGLQLPAGTEFMIGLRRSIEEVETVQDPAFVSAVFEWLTLEYGVAFVDHLWRWESVFQYGIDDDGGAFEWSEVVFHGEGLKDLDVPEFISVLHNILTMYPVKEICELVPSTEWDRYVCSREEYDEMTMDCVENTIYHYSFVSAWHQALHTASRDVDWAEVHRWGIRAAEHIGRSFARPEPPKAWELPLPWR